MATFRVGQRVRVVHSDFCPDLIGREGTVVGDLRLATRPSAGINIKWMGYPVRLDGWADDTNPSTGNKYWPAPHKLSPIQPERNQVVSWRECVWQPPHMRESA